MIETNIKESQIKEKTNKKFDDGFVKIFPYKEAVIVEKYTATEITGEQQQAICTFIAENYGLSQIGIVVRSVKYGMSMEAMMLLKAFMAKYEGPFAFVEPFTYQSKSTISDYSNGAYLNHKVAGTFPSIQSAYDELIKRT